MEQVITEIKGDMQEDTVDFLLQIIDGFNFMIETYNVTRDIVNDPEVLIMIRKKIATESHIDFSVREFGNSFRSNRPQCILYIYFNSQLYYTPNSFFYNLNKMSGSISQFISYLQRLESSC